jgi:hypothetical protein
MTERSIFIFHALMKNGEIKVNIPQFFCNFVIEIVKKRLYLNALSLRKFRKGNGVHEPQYI